jgi:hypothetical protein
MMTNNAIKLFGCLFLILKTFYSTYKQLTLYSNFIQNIIICLNSNHKNTLNSGMKQNKVHTTQLVNNIHYFTFT